MLLVYKARQPETHSWLIYAFRTINVFPMNFEITVGPLAMSLHSTSLHYNIDEMLIKLNSCLYQLIYGKAGFSICHFAAVPRTC